MGKRNGKKVPINEPKPDSDGTEALEEFTDKFMALGREAVAAGVGFVFSCYYSDRLERRERVSRGWGGIGHYALKGVVHDLKDAIEDGILYIEVDDDEIEDDDSAGDTADV